MSLQTETRSSPQKLFNTLYFLNKSCTKKLLVGLDIVDKEPGLVYEPVVHFVGVEYNGIRFNTVAWGEFKTYFDDISAYLRGENNNLRDNRVLGTGWSLRFTNSHSDKALEIEEERRPTAFPVLKKFRTSVIIKKVTFDRLREVSVCVDKRLKYLNELEDTVKLLVDKVCAIVENKCVSIYDTQITNYTEEIVENALNHLDTNDLMLLKNEVCAVHKESLNLSNFEFESLYFELIILHTAKIVTFLNSKLYNI